MSERETESPYKGYLPPDKLGIPEPHDTLAAEEFGIGTRDDRWPTDPGGHDRPHDTLAAEEFAIGTPDDRWPREPRGYEQPHDTSSAAEAFPMPLPGVGGGSAGSGRAPRAC